ncbi:sensor histidine kinase [Fastidiosibacter lacustris]|uniref:sensor histidine kinase n=1 Tax=Fastidiosibacter lacustris TaxID=2056695 RepID=UPI000E34B9B6|nr:HAMP domain-containing sensor histidine kinase [Fastidiosibacter lacustris]
MKIKVKTKIYFWIIPKLFIVFLLLNATFIIISYFNYYDNRYSQTIYSLTNAVFNLHYNALPNAENKQSSYLNTWPDYIKYNLSDNGIFSKKLMLNIAELQQGYKSQTYREVRKRIQELLPKSEYGYGKNGVSICYQDIDFCVDFVVENTNRIYLYLLLVVSLLFIAFMIPIYFAYTQKLLKPYIKMQKLAENLGLKVKKHSLFTPFFMQDTADLMVQVSDKVQTMLDEAVHTLAALSHDLKTPLTKAKLYMQNSIPEVYHQELLKYYADMEYLLNQMNVYNEKAHKIEKTQLVELVNFIDATCHEYQINFFNVKFESEFTSVVLPLQRKAFKRAVQNLIDNAIKYANGVTVIVTKIPNENVLCVRFTDEGPGVDPQFIEKLCDPFFRMDQARSHNLPGFGLGLSIVKEIVEHNNAHLEIYNHPDKRGLVVDIKWNITECQIKYSYL